MRWLFLVAFLGCDSDVRTAGNDDDAAVVEVDAYVQGPLTNDCASYCGGIMAACVDANAQFATAAQCMTTCMQYGLGAIGDTGTSTLGCRVHHTELARMDPSMHCQHAGPSGGGICGGKCDAICDIVPGLCPGSFGPNCNCNNIPASSMPYSTASNTGDTLECRLNQAIAGNCDAAAKNSPDAPCE